MESSNIRRAGGRLKKRKGEEKLSNLLVTVLQIEDSWNFQYLTVFCPMPYKAHFARWVERKNEIPHWSRAFGNTQMATLPWLILPTLLCWGKRLNEGACMLSFNPSLLLHSCITLSREYKCQPCGQVWGLMVIILNGSVCQWWGATVATLQHHQWKPVPASEGSDSDLCTHFPVT